MSGLAGASPLVLASGSAARKELLTRAGLAFTVATSAVDEDEVKRGARAEGASAEATALLLAELKATRVSRSQPEALVIGADQLLVCEERWFDKPADLAQARRQLQALRGRTHTLVTAVACLSDGHMLWHHVARPRLTMRAFSDAFLDAYLRLEGDILLKSVGAYRLEGPGIQLFEAVSGEQAAIIGLPLLPLLAFLRQAGVLAI